MRFLIVFLLVVSFTPRSFAECEPTGLTGQIEGKPRVMVSPIYPEHELTRRIEGCLTLGYILIPKDPERPNELVADIIIVLGSTEDKRGAFAKAAKQALGKWLFLARSHQAAATTSYYSVISFDIAAYRR